MRKSNNATTNLSININKFNGMSIKMCHLLIIIINACVVHVCCEKVI